MSEKSLESLEAQQPTPNTAECALYTQPCSAVAQPGTLRMKSASLGVASLLVLCIALSLCPRTTADLPVHCLYEDVVGLWMFSMGERGHTNTLTCDKLGVLLVVVVVVLDSGLWFPVAYSFLGSGYPLHLYIAALCINSSLALFYCILFSHSAVPFLLRPPIIFFRLYRNTYESQYLLKCTIDKVVTQVQMTLEYPNIAYDEHGNEGTWTLIDDDVCPFSLFTHFNYFICM